ncbi:MAG: OPT/YSL family transporter [Zetaproteobacteria bacterium]|nr:OPT/YSL family transporter [Zetaproteobacteria bacterium]
MQDKFNLRPYPELTLPAIICGLCVGSAIALSMGYASVLIGFSSQGAELGAILSVAFLRNRFYQGSMLELNISQTIASAVNGASAGMMFTLPAMYILQTPHIQMLPITFACIAGAILGIGFIAPLRKHMIDLEKLPFPSGIAVATLIQTTKNVNFIQFSGLGIGMAAGVGVKCLSWYFATNQLSLSALLGLDHMVDLSVQVSLLALATGFLAGKGGVFFVIGGSIASLVITPLVISSQAGEPLLPAFVRDHYFRHLGIGMLIGGAAIGIIGALPFLASTLRTMHKEARDSKSSGNLEELAPRTILGCILLGSGILFLMMHRFLPMLSLSITIAYVVLSLAWIWMASIVLAECLGRTNWTPLSGMTLLVITVLCLVAQTSADPAMITAAISLGAAASVAMAHATDLMTDLRAGYLLGAQPKKQQMAQMLGCWLGPLLIAGLLYVLHQVYGLGTAAMPAPQAQIVAQVIEDIRMNELPISKYLAGAGLGAILSASGIGGLGILTGLGFYFPFPIVMSYGIGTLLHFLNEKFNQHPSGNYLPATIIASGCIVGESLCGILLAILDITQHS